MRTLKTIIAAICFCGLFFTPDDNAPLKNLIFKSEDKEQV